VFLFAVQVFHVSYPQRCPPHFLQETVICALDTHPGVLATLIGTLWYTAEVPPKSFFCDAKVRLWLPLGLIELPLHYVSQPSQGSGTGGSAEGVGGSPKRGNFPSDIVNVLNEKKYVILLMIQVVFKKADNVIQGEMKNDS